MLILFWTFLKIGLFTFGSGYAMLALAETEVVRRHGWLNSEQFSDAVALSEITPGPIMVNMATFVGSRVGGISGAVTATLGLVIPPFIIILFITRLYGSLKGQPLADAFFRGLRPGILALIAIVLLRIGKASVPDIPSALVAAAVIGAVYILNLHPILAAVGAGLAGLVFFR